MNTITFDTKTFDYSLVREPLVAVPKSVFENYIKKHVLIKTEFEKTSPKWKLTKKSLKNTYKKAISDIKLKKTISADKVLNGYV